MEPLFRQILVAIDGSEPSLQAVQMALGIAALCAECKITGLYVIDKLVLNELVRFSARSQAEVQSELEEQGRKYLELASKEAQRKGFQIACQTHEGDPFEQIVAAANRLHADLIVMGHTGRRGTSRVLIGSVTQRVLDYAPCPVLVMK